VYPAKQIVTYGTGGMDANQEPAFDEIPSGPETRRGDGVYPRSSPRILPG